MRHIFKRKGARALPSAVYYSNPLPQMVWPRLRRPGRPPEEDVRDFSARSDEMTGKGANRQAGRRGRRPLRSIDKRGRTVEARRCAKSPSPSGGRCHAAARPQVTVEGESCILPHLSPDGDILPRWGKNSPFRHFAQRAKCHLPHCYATVEARIRFQKPSPSRGRGTACGG